VTELTYRELDYTKSPESNAANGQEAGMLISGLSFWLLDLAAAVEK
jgi:hypothetical protein